jgi:D-glycero-alpha-D-manno-heptose 1-phosphate guanylyltransferase
MECIVLAGGLGTRLQGVIGQQPKCMAPVAGKPFIHYLFTWMAAQGCDHVILSLGFRHDAVLTWLETSEWPFRISYVIEEEQLGTGGGIALALTKASRSQVIVVNGDTMFNVDLKSLLEFHTAKDADVTLALKKMYAFDRYGVVRTEADTGRIIAFEEKKYCEQGLINGGIYVISKPFLETCAFPLKWSFEKELLEAYVGERQFYGQVSGAYFIDIGIPEDYTKAQTELRDLEY